MAGQRSRVAGVVRRCLLRSLDLSAACLDSSFRISKRSSGSEARQARVVSPARAAMLGIVACGLLGGRASGAVLRVTSSADSGAGTLRQAISTAEANGTTDIIVVDTPGPIVLASQLPAISTDVVIRGAGQTVSGNNSVRIFRVNGGNVRLSDLTLANGRNAGDNGGNGGGGQGGGGAGLGGALLVMGGTADVARVTFSGNGATGGNAGTQNCTPGAGGGGAGGGAGGDGGVYCPPGRTGGNANGWGSGGAGAGSWDYLCFEVGEAGGDFGGGGGGASLCASSGGNGGFGGGGGGGGYRSISVTFQVNAPGGVGGLHGGRGNTGAFIVAGDCGAAFKPPCPSFHFGGGGGAGLGGAIFVDAGALNVTDSAFTGNSVAGGFASDGGTNGSGVAHAIYNRNGTVNTGNVTYDNATNHLFGIIGTTATTTGQAGLTVSVTDALTTAFPAQALTYTLIVDNTGPDSAPIAAVHAALPAGLTGVTWGCAASGGATCSASGSGTPDDMVMLPPGGRVRYTINTTVSPSFAGALSTTASVAALEGGASASDTTEVQSAALAITKSHSGNFTQGSTAVWTLQVSNQSTTTATGGSVTTVRDTFPVGYSLASQSGVGTGWSCGQSVNFVICTSGAVVNGNGGLFPLLSLTVNVPASSPVSVSNSASVFGGGDATHWSAGTAAVSNLDTVTVIQVPASIAINGSATQAVPFGSAFGSLAVTVRDAGNVVIPNYSPVVFTAPASGPSGTFDNGARTKSVPANASGIADPGTFTSNASAGVYTVDVAAGPAPHATFLLTNTAPDLTIVKSNDVGGALATGNRSTLPYKWSWILHVANAGNLPATFAAGQTIATDDLPDLSSYPFGVTITNATGITGTPAGTVTFSGDHFVINVIASGGSVTIAPGGSFDIAVETIPATDGTFVNPRSGGSARVDPANHIVEGNESNNTGASSVVVTAPDLTITKTNDTGGATTLGSSFRWTVTFANGGSEPATFLAGQDFLIDELSRTDLNAGGLTPGAVTGVAGSANIECTLLETVYGLYCTAMGGDVTISPGGSYSLSYTVTPSATGIFTSTATIDFNDWIQEGGDPRYDANIAIDSVTVTAPDLTLSKANNVSNATTLGSNWTWTLTVANSGDAPAIFTAGQVIVADDLPGSGLSYGSVTMANATGVSGPLAGSISSNNLSVVANGGTVTIATGGSFDIVFTATPLATGTFSNPRSAGTAAADPNNSVVESNETNNAAGSNSVTVTAPDLTLVKSNDVSGTVLLGNDWTWTLRVANGGAEPASFANAATILIDNLPNSGVVFGAPVIQNASGVTGTISCGINGTFDLSCTASGAVTLAPGAAFDVRFTATPSVLGTFVNPRSSGSAAVDPNNGVVEGNESNNAASDSVTVASADLVITKTAPATAVAGDVNGFDYTLTVTNNGPFDNVGGFTVSDTLPAALTFQSTGSSSECSSIGQLVTCTSSTGLTFGSTRPFTVRVTLPASATGTVSNTASVASSGTIDAVPANDTSSVATTITPQANLLVTKSGPGSAIAGAPAGFDYSITVRNNGPSDHSGGFTVTDLLPAALTFQSAGSDAGCSASGQTVTCTDAGLIAAATKSFAVHVTLASSAAGGSAVSNTASVSNGTPDEDLSDNTSNAVATTVQAEADLSIVKSGPAFATAGSTFDYTLTVTNSGPSQQTGAMTVTDTLPTGLTFVPVGSDAGCSASGQLVTCTSSAGLIVDAAKNFSVRVALAAAVPSGATLSNSASVASSGTPDPNAANNGSNTVQTTVQTNADLAIVASGPATAVAGTDVTYAISITNNGSSDAQNVAISDALPVGVTFVAQSQTSGAPLTLGANGNVVNDTIATLPAGASAAILVIGHVSANVANASALANAASVSTATTDSVTPNNTATATTTVVAQADLSVTKTAATLVAPGGVLVYTITVANNGPSDAQSVTLSDPLPADAVFASQTQDSGPSFTLAASGNAITGTVATLAAGVTASFTVTTRVRSSPASVAITNTASVSSTTTDPAGANNSAAATTRLDRRPAAAEDAYATMVGDTLTVEAPGVLANDSDADDDAITAHLVADVAHGTLTLRAGGSFTYVPDAGFFGSDRFTYQACDPLEVCSAGAVVTITVLRSASAVVTGGGSICVGGSATVTAELLGTPPWRLIWSDGLTETVFATRSTRSVTPETTTIYTLTSLNDYNGGGTATGSATVTVAEVAPPVITGPSFVMLGSPLTLTATTGFDSYQWFHDGTAIAGAFRSTFTIPAAAASDAGSYRVVAVQGACSSSSSASVIVSVAANEAILAVIGTTQGAGGAFFRTALQLSNDGAAAIDGEINVFTAAAGKTATPYPYSLDAYETRSYDDIVPSGAGLASANIVPRAGFVPIGLVHVFNDLGAFGTAGMIERPVMLDRTLAAGDQAVLIAPADPVATRFNIGVRALAGGLVLHGVVRDASGVIRGQFAHTYTESSFSQTTAASFAGLTLGGSDVLILEVTSGRGVLYGAATDNRTNDPNMQFAQKVRDSRDTRYVMTVVGSTAGAFGSYFKTGVQIHNPGAAAMEARLVFHPAGRVGSDDDPSMPVTIAPNATKTLPDLLEAMGATGVGSLDLITTSSTRPVAVVRVYSISDAGQTSMTEDLVAENEALRVGQSAVLLAPHHPQASRFNIGVRSLSGGAKITAVVRDATGAIMRTVHLTVPSMYFEQRAATDLLGVPFTGDESVTCTIVEGAAILYGVWTDNRTQDPSLHFAVVR